VSNVNKQLELELELVDPNPFIQLDLPGDPMIDNIAPGGDDKTEFEDIPPGFEEDWLGKIVGSPCEGCEDDCDDCFHFETSAPTKTD